MANSFDITIDGTQAKIARGVEGSFRERSVRAEITQNLLTQAEGSGLASRPDQPVLYQSDWSGGYRWWKPIISPSEQNSYFLGTNLDMWSQPGKVVPMNKGRTVENADDELIHKATVLSRVGNDLYAIGEDASASATTQLVVTVWTPASDNFVATTIGAGVTDDPVAATYQPSDGYVYVAAEASRIGRFHPTNKTSNTNLVTGFTTYPGTNIFLQNQNLMLYSGDQLYTVVEPTVTSVFNDGLGPELIDMADVSSGVATETGQFRLAISTPEGIYYVKNTQQNGQTIAFIFRVDRDAAGNWVGNPLGTLPVGTVALAITYHLGSIIISTADAVSILGGTSFLGITFYHLTQGSLGVLGRIPHPTDTAPYRFLGSDGQYLYIGGNEKVWVYDAVQGGLHLAYANTSAGVNFSDFRAMASVADSAGVPSLLFIGDNQASYMVKLENSTAPDTVTAFGDDETFYTLESNYFDMNLPMETKDITKVALMTDTASTASAQEWTLQVSTDDGAFADVLTHSGTAQYAEASITPGTHRGRLFRYKLIYQTKVAAKRALRAVLITANAGQMVREWDVILDGTSLMNVNNQPVRPAALAEAMRATAAKEQAISVTFNYQDQTIDTSADTGETVSVKVQLCEIIKDAPNEALIHLTLREV